MLRSSTQLTKGIIKQLLDFQRVENIVYILLIMDSHLQGIFMHDFLEQGIGDSTREN